MNFKELWSDKARHNPKRILLPEGEDPRVLSAAIRAKEMGVCKPELLGNAERIQKLANDLGFQKAQLPPISDFPNHPLFDSMCAKYAELRATSTKPANTKIAARMLSNPVFFAAMLLREGHADGVVAGATHTTADVITAGKYVLGLVDGVPEVSSSFIMLGKNKDMGHEGAFVFADCGANIEPDVEQYAGIVLASASTAKSLLFCEPKVALLSFSTYGSATHPRVEKVRDGLKLVRELAPNLMVDGELQVDAAIIPSVAQRKCPDSPIEGKANTLVFPDLNSGNIAYKLVERLAGAEAIGPLLQGLTKPMSDLSRGCSTEDIVQTLTVMSVLGGENNRATGK